MKKMYLSLVIVLASVFMVNEATAQQYFSIDNQRADDARIRIEWWSCFGSITTNTNVCANSSVMITVPVFDAVMKNYRVDQTTFVCTGNTGYRIGFANYPATIFVAVCNDFTNKQIYHELWSGATGGTPIGHSVLNYYPGNTYQGYLDLLPY